MRDEKQTNKQKIIILLATVRAPYKIFLLGWGASQVVAERSIDDVDDPNDDHKPGEANGMHNGTPSGWACEE